MHTLILHVPTTHSKHTAVIGQVIRQHFTYGCWFNRVLCGVQHMSRDGTSSGVRIIQLTLNSGTSPVAPVTSLSGETMYKCMLNTHVYEVKCILYMQCELVDRLTLMSMVHLVLWLVGHLHSTENKQKVKKCAHSRLQTLTHHS